MEADEIDLAILDLFAAGEEVGVSPTQMHRLLQAKIHDAYLIASEMDDRWADDPMPSVSIH